MPDNINWIDLYVNEYTKETESPTSYHMWTAISMICAALQRKVWINFGQEDNPFTIYCNLYVVFVAPPGTCRKTQAIRYGKELILDIDDVSIASDSVTREALIMELVAARTTMAMDDEGDIIEPHCSLTLLSGEFSVFLGQKNLTLLSLLCELFDCEKVWKYATKHAGKDTLQGVWFSILGATTPELLTSSLPITAIGGGLTSRIVFVVEHQRRKKVTSPYLPPMIRAILIERLRDINRMKGEMHFKDGAFKYFDEWYQSSPDGVTEFDQRQHVYVLKVAMIFAAANARNYIIVEDVARAIQEIDIIKPRMTEAFQGVGRSEYGYVVSRLRSLLREEGVVRLDTFLANNAYDVTPKDITNAVQIFEYSGEAHHTRIGDHHVLKQGRPDRECLPQLDTGDSKGSN